MAYNKVEFNGNTIIDITPTTAIASDVKHGEIFYLANGTQAVGSMLTCPIECIEYDYNIGYIQNGTWNYEKPTNTYTDIYEAKAGHTYIITLGANVGTRFRSMFTTVDIRTKTHGSVSGTNIINLNNPAAYRNVTYKATANGYILVAKDNIGESGIFTYVYDSEGWL